MHSGSYYKYQQYVLMIMHYWWVHYLFFVAIIKQLLDYTYTEMMS